MSKPTRDLRLDFFRGLALIFIFLNHIPDNGFNWITSRNFGFSDATEIFVFISGYSAMLAYGSILLRTGPIYASIRILNRCWDIYVAHIFMFVLFTAQIAYITSTFQNPLYAEEMQVLEFLNRPADALIAALLLEFRPRNMDVLPLYIVLLLAFPPVLIGLMRWPKATLATSFGLYGAAHVFGWNLPAAPAGNVWFFNPCAWQFLFVLGAWFGLRHAAGAPALGRHPVLFGAALAFLIFSFLVVLTWHLPPLGMLMPQWLAILLYPIDKTNLDVLRLVHFLALAVVTVRLVPSDASIRACSLARPVVACGQQSLYIFCLGTFLSFVGQFVLTEVNGSIGMQAMVSVVGIGVMFGLAAFLRWYAARGAAPSDLHRSPLPAARGETA